MNKASVKRTLGFILMLIFVFGGVALFKGMRRNQDDSSNATLASVLRSPLMQWFDEKGEFPASLDAVWNGPLMQEYREKYSIPDECRFAFTYSGHSNWYEMTFTNFGNLHTQIGSNGIVLK